MKKRIQMAMCLFVLIAFSASAQELSKGKKVSTDDYVRNSVCLIMMEDASVPQTEILEEIFLSAPLSKKYNDHNVYDRVIKPEDYPLSDADRAPFDLACTSTEDYLNLIASGEAAPKQTKFKEGLFNDIMKKMISEASQTVDTVTKVNVARTANRFLLEKAVAKQLANKWFIDADGNFTSTVLDERGLLNASQADIAAAADMGELSAKKAVYNELIGNTFVVVSRFSYKDKESLLADIMLPIEVAAEVAIQSGVPYAEMAKAAIATTKTATAAALGDGYYVVVDSYLFRMRWNDAIEDGFNGAFNGPELDKDAYDKLPFSLQFIGNERAWARTRAALGSGKSDEELMRPATIDAVNLVLAKFESKYDEFKTKTPLVVGEGTDKKGKPVQTYGAYIGTRDGLTGGEVFEVLEKKIIEKENGTHRVEYVKKGELTVDKANIWDNTETKFAELAESGAENTPQLTTLVGKGKTSYYDGMLLRMKSKKGKK